MGECVFVCHFFVKQQSLYPFGKGNDRLTLVASFKGLSMEYLQWLNSIERESKQKRRNLFTRLRSGALRSRSLHSTPRISIGTFYAPKFNLNLQILTEHHPLFGLLCLASNCPVPILSYVYIPLLGRRLNQLPLPVLYFSIGDVSVQN